MGTVYKADATIMATVEDLIAKFHPHLATISKQIAVTFKEKATEVGGVKILGKVGKAPTLLGVLGEIDYKFVIELPQDEWLRLTDQERVALLDHYLCGCGAIENEKTGEMRYFKRPPHVVFYREEVERHGFWRNGSKKAPDANLIEELFGKADDEEEEEDQT